MIKHKQVTNGEFQVLVLHLQDKCFELYKTKILKTITPPVVLIWFVFLTADKSRSVCFVRHIDLNISVCNAFA